MENAAFPWMEAWRELSLLCNHKMKLNISASKFTQPPLTLGAKQQTEVPTTSEQCAFLQRAYKECFTSARCFTGLYNRSLNTSLGSCWSFERYLQHLNALYNVNKCLKTVR